MREDDFFEAIDAIRQLTSNSLLVDNPLLPRSHDLTARILRHGLSVSSFALLEKYLEEVFKDFLSYASVTAVPYSDMTEDFRKLVTISAVTGMLNRLSFKPRTSQLNFFENEVTIVSKFLETPAKFSWHGFSPKGSNVGKDDISVALKALGVDKPWIKLGKVTAELGSPRADLGVDYENLARTRHTSAHNPTGNVPTADLETNLTVSILIAASISLVLGSLKKIFREANNVAELIARSKDPAINVRFLDENSSGQWHEKKSSYSRVVKKYSDFSSAVAGAKSRKGGSAIVVRNSSGIPVRLIS